MNIKKRNLYLVLAAVLIFIIFVCLAFITLTSNGSLFGNTRIPPQELPSGPGGGESRSDDKSRFVTQLIHKTPHEGTNFSFYYNIDNDEYTLYLNPKNITAGNAEFDTFLKENGVNDRSWIDKLKTVYVKPSPGS